MQVKYSNEPENPTKCEYSIRYIHFLLEALFKSVYIRWFLFDCLMLLYQLAKLGVRISELILRCVICVFMLNFDFNVIFALQ